MEDKETHVVVYILRRLFEYNCVELLFIVGFGVGYLSGGVWPGALWAGFVLSAVWVLLVSSRDAHEHAKELTLTKNLFITDTIGGVILLGILAFMVRYEHWQFPVMFLLAAAQHVRYTLLIRKWLLEPESE